jgi:hypothetical protein
MFNDLKMHPKCSLQRQYQLTILNGVAITQVLRCLSVSG